MPDGFYFSLLDISFLSELTFSFSILNIDIGGNDRSLLHIEKTQSRWHIDILFFHIRK